jgi:hypothetical protein
MDKVSMRQEDGITHKSLAGRKATIAKIGLIVRTAVTTKIRWQYRSISFPKTPLARRLVERAAIQE